MSKKIDKEIERWAGIMVKNGFSIHVSTLAPYLYRVYKDEIVNGEQVRYNYGFHFWLPNGVHHGVNCIPDALKKIKLFREKKEKKEKSD